ncbi:MAG: hypothetical protein CVV44_20330 [Spirochaetae bacterium HGW-Spirochaetae-1]|jgi:hypothetical protein|nr:MAG: hypothetical protein CVV44_20330 [Spirochaetae bacterium HGW-Spirochaetae-1]
MPPGGILKRCTVTAEQKREQEWQAECDARSLREAEEVKADQGRFERAKAAMKKEVGKNEKINTILKGILEEKQ